MRLLVLCLGNVLTGGARPQDVWILLADARGWGDIGCNVRNAIILGAGSVYYKPNLPAPRI